MPRGGKRRGAGRPKGSKNRKKPPACADPQALPDPESAFPGKSPGDVMYRCMLNHLKAGRWDRAAAIARDLAPYVHPRKSSIRHEGLQALTVTLIEEIILAAEEPPALPAPAGNGQPQAEAAP